MFINKEMYEILWSLSGLVPITAGNYCELKQTGEDWSSLTHFGRESLKNDAVLIQSLTVVCRELLPILLLQLTPFSHVAHS